MELPGHLALVQNLPITDINLCLNHYRKAILSVKFSLHLEQLSMVIGVDGQTGQAAA